MATLYRAAWLLPITAPPVRGGWVLVEDGRVAAAGGGEAPRAAHEIALGRVAVLPGLVNAHTHLELSWLRARIPPAGRMPEWIRALMALRRDVHRDDPLAMAAAAAEVRRAGTSIVGDVTNTLASVHALGASPMRACIFYEVLGFNHPSPRERIAEAAAMVRGVNARAVADSGGEDGSGAQAGEPRIRASVVPHAPYSVSPALFREIAALASRERWTVSVHLAESVEEVEFLRTGRGAWRELLELVGVWTDDWRPPGTGPLAYFESFAPLTPRTLVVHGVQLAAAELARIAEAGATIVTCPRSNRWVGAGDPPLARFLASGARVAFGTDSLASCPDLNVFHELAAAYRLAPDAPPSRLLHAATRAGAEALGFADHGALEPGFRADLIAVDVPDGTTDVEQYLCSGISPDAIRWLGSGLKT